MKLFLKRLCFFILALTATISSTMSRAQNVSVVTVNGVSCSSSNAVSVTFNAGVMNIQTGGCGTTTAPTTPPTIANLSALSGIANAPLVISGTNLSGATVIIGGQAANIVSNSGAQIFTNIPSNVISGVSSVVVTTNGGSASFAFTVLPVTITPILTPPPSINLVSPAAASVGTNIIISGTGLSASTVSIGGANATILLNSTTSITVVVPVPATAVTGLVNIVVSNNIGSTSTPFTVMPSTQTASGSDISIDGLILANPSKRAFLAPPFRNGLMGAGSEVNAYAMLPTRCNTVPALNRSWQHNIDLNDYKGKNAFDFFVMQANESLSYKFVVSNTDMSGGFIYNDASNAVVRPTFLSITSTPCNFDASKVVSGINRDACFQTGLNGNSVNWVNITGVIPVSYCRLVKGQTYYLNLRFQDARSLSDNGSPTTDSCTMGNCGGILQVL